MDAEIDDLTPLTTGDTHAPVVGVPGVTFTVREAARSCAVHANTVRRRLKGGEFPNAFRDHTGTWRIPVVDLEAAGLRPQRSRPEPHQSDVVIIPEARPTGLPTLREAYDALQMVEEEADTLRDRVQELERRAAFAETLAHERAERIDDLRLALRALEAVNPRPEERLAGFRPVRSEEPTLREDPPAGGIEAPPRRSRWRRRA